MVVKTLGDRFVYAKRGAGPKPVILIKDWKWWMATETEVHEWMDRHLANGRLSQKGMMVVFSTEQELTLFILKWG